MPEIFPFRALRPAAEAAAQIASVPYDVVNREESKALAEGNPWSFLHVVRPEIDFEDSVSPYADEVYQKASDNLKKLKSEGKMIQDSDKLFYLYRQVMGNHSQYGLVCCVKAEDYFNNIIKKHELTRKDKEADRTRHVLETNANTGPVFLTYRDNGEAKLFEEISAAKPDYDFTAPDGIQHTFWVVRDSELSANLQAQFGKLPCAYIADGHHRSAAGALAAKARAESNPEHSGDEEYNRYLAILFPHNQLKILGYNRAVKSMQGVSSEAVLEKLAELGEITPLEHAAEPEQRHYVNVYTAGKWYSLRFRKDLWESAGVVESLDVALLQNHVLSPMFGIDDPRTSENISFIGGIRGTKELEKLVDNGSHEIAFCMHPTSVEELMDIADAGEIMPPKSTWFEPKLRSGLVVHLLDD